MVDTCPMFVQAHGMDSTKSEPNVIYGLGEIGMCQCRFIRCNKSVVPLWWGMAIAEEAVYICQQGFMGTLYFPLNFIVNLKLF